MIGKNYYYGSLKISLDKKRTENFKGHIEEPEIKDEITWNLGQYHEGDRLDWETDYVLASVHVSKNKEMIGEIDNYFTESICNWEIVEKKDRYFYAYNSPVNVIK